MKKVKEKRFFDYKENQRDLIIALFVALVLVGLEIIKFIFTNILQFLKFSSTSTTSLVLILPIPLLFWVIASNGESLSGFKNTNLSNKLKYYSKMLFLFILIYMIIVYLILYLVK